MAEPPLKISVSIEILGKNKCEPLPSDFGQSERTAVSFDVCFGEETSLQVAVGATLARLVEAINVSRPLQTIAELACHFESDIGAEDELVKAAVKVCDQYDQWDGKVTANAS